MAAVPGGTHAEGMAPQVLLAGEALPAGLAGVRPLPSVRADVALEDPLLLGRVRAERALVQLDGHHQHVTLGIKTHWVSSGAFWAAGRAPRCRSEGESCSFPLSLCSAYLGFPQPVPLQNSCSCSALENQPDCCS